MTASDAAEAASNDADRSTAQAAGDPMQEVDWSVASPMIIGQAVVVFTFFGLWVWSRSAPLPAAIVGLVIYVSLNVIAVMIDPTNLIKGIIFKILIIVLLCKGIGAGLKHRQLQQQGR